MPCTLHDRESGQPAANPGAEWFDGEFIITDCRSARISPAGVTDGDWFAARDDAVDKARTSFTRRFCCEGVCGNADKLCVVAVDIVTARSGKVVEQEITCPATQWLAERRIVRKSVTYQVQARPRCDCISRPVIIRPSSTPAEPAQPQFPVIPFPIWPFGFGLGAVGGGAAGAAVDAPEMPPPADK